jgi:hypothetical protein
LEAEDRGMTKERRQAKAKETISAADESKETRAGRKRSGRRPKRSHEDRPSESSTATPNELFAAAAADVHMYDFPQEQNVESLAATEEQRMMRDESEEEQQKCTKQRKNWPENTYLGKPEMAVAELHTLCRCT